MAREHRPDPRRADRADAVLWFDARGSGASALRLADARLRASGRAGRAQRLGHAGRAQRLGVVSGDVIPSTRLGGEPCRARRQPATPTNADITSCRVADADRGCSAGSGSAARPPRRHRRHDLEPHRKPAQCRRAGQVDAGRRALRPPRVRAVHQPGEQRAHARAVARARKAAQRALRHRRRRVAGSW